MTNEEFQLWLAGVEQLTAAQRERLQQVAQEQGDEAASRAAIELRFDERRRCPRCGAGGATRTGCAAAPARPAGGRSTRWPGCTTAGLRAGAGGPRVGPQGRRKLRGGAVDGVPLAGLVEADETCCRQSRKGERGLSREPVPVRVATARGGETAGEVLETASQPSPRACLRASLAPQCTRFAN